MDGHTAFAPRTHDECIEALCSILVSPSTTLRPRARWPGVRCRAFQVVLHHLHRFPFTVSHETPVGTRPFKADGEKRTGCQLTYADLTDRYSRAFSLETLVLMRKQPETSVEKRVRLSSFEVRAARWIEGYGLAHDTYKSLLSA